MTIVDEIHDYVKEQCGKEANPFGHDAYHVHFVTVAKYAGKMADATGADMEVVMLAAWLHDIGSVMGYYDDHHIFGAKHAEEILKEKGYSPEKTKRVVHAIRAHRGSRDIARETIEAECVCDADAMCHFDNLASLFRLALVTKGMDTESARVFVKGKLERSWKKLTPRAKKMMRPKYKSAMLLLE